MQKFLLFLILTFTHYFVQAFDGDYLKESFEPSVDALPANFKGHNQKDIFNFLSKNITVEKILKKDEFETTDSHKNRLEKFISNNFDGNLSLLNTRFAFVVEKPAIDFKYDADKSSLEYLVCFGSYFDQNDPEYYKKPSKTTVRGNTSKEILGYENMQNSYGTTVKVEITKQTNIEYVVYGGKIQKISGKPCEVKGEIKLTPDEAKLYKKNGYNLLVFGKLVSPFISERSLVTNKPTFNDPRLVTSTDYSIHIQEEGLWLIDAVTGRIFKKIF